MERYVTVVTEMLAQRGYVPETVAYDFPHFVMSAQAPSNGERGCVLSNFESKIAIGPMQQCVAFMDEHGFGRAIVVYTDAVTPHVAKLVDALWIGGLRNGSPIRIELFSRAELGYNVTKHALVPRHELASADEIKQLKKYTGKLPLLLSTDPVARFLGFVRGDLVKITRRSGLVVFRAVV